MPTQKGDERKEKKEKKKGTLATAKARTVARNDQ